MNQGLLLQTRSRTLGSGIVSCVKVKMGMSILSHHRGLFATRCSVVKLEIEAANIVDKYSTSPAYFMLTRATNARPGASLPLVAEPHLESSIIHNHLSL